jgi:hypothetical protein
MAWIAARTSADRAAPWFAHLSLLSPHGPNVVPTQWHDPWAAAAGPSAVGPSAAGPSFFSTDPNVPSLPEVDRGDPLKDAALLPAQTLHLLGIDPLNPPATVPDEARRR